VVGTYADHYFEYDSSKRVKSETVAGAGGATTSGFGTYTYSYSTSGNSPGFNSWHTQTVETFPDASTDTIYTNAYAQARLDGGRLSDRLGDPPGGDGDGRAPGGVDLLPAIGRRCDGHRPGDRRGVPQRQRDRRRNHELLRHLGLRDHPPHAGDRDPAGGDDG